MTNYNRKKARLLKQFFTKKGAESYYDKHADADSILMNAADGTQLNQLETRLNTINSLKDILDHIYAGIWMRESATGRFTYVSKGLEEIFQIPLENLQKDPDMMRKMVLPEHRKELFNKYKLLRSGERVQHKYCIKCKDGTKKWVLEQIIPKTNEDGIILYLFGMITDISHEKNIEEQLSYNATHDPLTSLPNQRSLYDKLDALCKNDATNNFALLYLDLDRFNIINNSLGHQIGDEALKLVAHRLLSILPEGGYLARLSSNDFIIIIENFSSKDSILRLTEEIIKRMEQQLTVNEYDFHITTSIGISIFPEDGHNKLALMERAHSALHHAKQQGKNNYQLYSFSKDITAYKKYVLEKDMRTAIVNKEFELYYQPQVEPQKGYIQSAEALIRWNHKEWGLVSPEEFIPLAEENHLIHPISDWIIKNVCAQLRAWKDKGYTLRPISINVSPILFLKKGLVELVKQQLTIYQIPANYLVFEITEGSILRNDKHVISVLERLKAVGVRIAIDDFGIGYASLHYLQAFRPDFLKIDQKFVRNIAADDTADAAIISSIIHLAKGLETEIVAEGIEDQKQLEFLKQKECDLLQGYLFSEPVPSIKFEHMMQTGYLKPNGQRKNNVPIKERRNYYRFEFPYPVLAEMSIVEVNKQKVNLSSAQILIENISLGGLKIISPLKLPTSSSMKFNFRFTLMNETFEINGTFIWKNVGKGDVHFYGVKFDVNETDKIQLPEVINKMSILSNLNQEIPDTNFIQESPHFIFRKK